MINVSQFFGANIGFDEMMHVPMYSQRNLSPFRCVYFNPRSGGRSRCAPSFFFSSNGGKRWHCGHFDTPDQTSFPCNNGDYCPQLSHLRGQVTRSGLLTFRNFYYGIVVAYFEGPLIAIKLSELREAARFYKMFVSKLRNRRAETFFNLSIIRDLSNEITFSGSWCKKASGRHWFQ